MRFLHEVSELMGPLSQSGQDNQSEVVGRPVNTLTSVEIKSTKMRINRGYLHRVFYNKSQPLSLPHRLKVRQRSREAF